jgi:hypothetical protein
MPELPYLALAARMNKSFTEIYEGWSERDVNLMFFYLRCQSIANEPDEIEFTKTIARLTIQSEQ